MNIAILLVILVLFVVLGLIAVLVVIIAGSGKKPETTDARPKVGGVYASKSEDGSYRITKVLAADAFAVHLRFYLEKFAAPPGSIDTSKLTVAIGHAPLALEAFMKEPDVLLKVEPVQDAELEGYRMYLEAMSEN